MSNLSAFGSASLYPSFDATASQISSGTSLISTIPTSLSMSSPSSLSPPRTSPLSSVSSSASVSSVSPSSSSSVSSSSPSFESFDPSSFGNLSKLSPFSGFSDLGPSAALSSTSRPSSSSSSVSASSPSSSSSGVHEDSDSYSDSDSDSDQDSDSDSDLPSQTSSPHRHRADFYSESPSSLATAGPLESDSSSPGAVSPSSVFAGSTSSGVRRRPSRLTSEQRQAIRMHKKRNPSMTQAQLSAWALHEFNLSHMPSQGMISVILSKVNYATRKKPKDTEEALLKFEQKMERWIRRRKRRITVRGAQKKAKTYARRYLVDILQPSQITREWTIAYLISHNALSKKELLEQLP